MAPRLIYLIYAIFSSMKILDGYTFSGSLVNIRPIEEKDDDVIRSLKNQPGSGAKFPGNIPPDMMLSPHTQSFICETKNNMPFGIISVGAFRLHESAATILLNIGYSDDALYAGKAILKHLFNEKKLNRMISYLLDYEKETEKLLLSLGFVREVTLRDHIFYQNSYHDVHIYGILEDEFKA